MLAAVVGEVAVVVVDHRDARAHEAGYGEDRDSRAEGEGRVGMAQVVEAARRVDPGSLLGGLPVAAAVAAEVDPAAPGIRKEDRTL